MLEILDIGTIEVIAYRLEGKITEEEMAQVLALFRKKISDGKKINVYQEVVSIGGVEFDAMVEKFKFFKELGFSHFGNIAVTTHKKWLHKLVDLEGKLFKNINMKGFSIEDKELALEFLRA